MTTPMQEIADGLKGINTRLDGQDATNKALVDRLRHMEKELGMEMPDDDEDAEKNMPTKDGEDTEGMDDDKGRTMSKGQMRAAARDKDRTARSGRYGDKHVEPNPGPSRNKHGDTGMSIGNMMRSALSGGMVKSGFRELEVLDEKYIPFGRDGLTVPFDFLAQHGRHADKIERKLADGFSPTKTIHAPDLRMTGDYMGTDGHVRTLTTTGASGVVGVDLDVERSQMWLAEVSPAFGYMNPVMGVMNEFQVWYGNVAPTGSAVAEGGAHTENTPTITRLRRQPVIVHMPWSITGNLMAMDSIGMASQFEVGVEQQLMQLVLLHMLSGPNAGDAFVADSNSYNGLLNSGSVVTPFGANADTSITGFNRAVVVAAESLLRKNDAMGDGLFWILSSDMVANAVNQRVGGTESVVFLAQRDVNNFREGLIGGAQNGAGTRYVESNRFGRTHSSPAYKRTAIATLGFGSQMIPIFFGQGIEFRLLRDPAKTITEYSLSAAVNYATVNPSNVTTIAQAIT